MPSVMYMWFSHSGVGNSRLKHPVTGGTATPHLGGNTAYIHTCSCLCLAGVRVSGDVPLLTHGSLEMAVQQVAQQIASLEALLSALESEQLHTVQEM